MDIDQPEITLGIGLGYAPSARGTAISERHVLCILQGEKPLRSCQVYTVLDLYAIIQSSHHHQYKQFCTVEEWEVLFVNNIQVGYAVESDELLGMEQRVNL